MLVSTLAIAANAAVPATSGQLTMPMVAALMEMTARAAWAAVLTAHTPATFA